MVHTVPVGQPSAFALRRSPLLLLLPGLLLAGCASQGPLRPPSLHLPAAVRDLSAQRVGTAVSLRWTTPSRTTDGVALAGKRGVGPLTAVICRMEGAGAACTETARVPVTSGQPGSLDDALTPSLSSGGARALTYRVRIVNGRGAGEAFASVETLAGAAPPAIAELHAEPTVGGAALRWRPDADAGADRILLHVVRGEAGTAPSGRADREALLAVEPAGEDPGGAMDAGARVGVSERYAVSRTRSVQVSGHALTMSSAPAVFTLSAGARPAPLVAPGGLEALVNLLAGPEVDLVWDMRDGAVAYVVYRAVGDGPFATLPTGPVSGLSFSDRDVRPGGRYRYQVAAEDASDQTGQPGREVVVTVPGP